ncbi:MAG TPA: DUF4924 domain-containing protein [Prolixibacteraceae bacterium]|nr:DUF4924 domain-containing protein [Prolixibacteraceae bacterium]
MLIARELRITNIAEYILYMWQVEDLLRACSFDPEKINQHLVARFKADENANKEIAEWYSNLAVMMEKEHVQEKGHLQVIINLVNDLNEFHLRMLEVQKDQEYARLYRTNQHSIAEIVKKTGLENEVEACLNALYGILILKLKNDAITESTKASVEGFGKLIGHLSARYIQFENDDFEF